MDTSIVKGGSGKISLMRVMSLFIVISIIGVFIAHNIMSMINGTGFISIGPEEAMLISGALAAKAAQRFGEGKRPIETTNELPVNKGE